MIGSPASETCSAMYFSAVAASMIFKYCAMLWLRKKKIQNYKDTGTVASIITYPIKSCKGIYLDEAVCEPIGILHHGVYDRSFVFVDSTGLYVTQRQKPKMALIQPSFLDDYLLIDAPNMPQLKVKKHIKPTPDNIAYCKLKMFVLKSVDCVDEAARWIDHYLGENGMRLLHFPSEYVGRDLCKQTKVWDHKAVLGDQTHYSDFCSYMLTSESTLNEINPNLPRPVVMKRFRPNFVMSGAPAFSEEQWAEFSISSVTFRVLDMCTRCVFVNVDPEKGEPDKDSEPLKTLIRLYSSPAYANKAMFGVDATCDDAGRVKVGDTIRAHIRS